MWPRGELGVLKVFKAAPIFMFAFTCHFNIFPICNELERNSLRRVNGVVHWCIGIVFVIYCAVGFCGYFTYGDAADSNVLNMYPLNKSVLVVRLGLSLAIAFSYPVLLHPCRGCLASMLFDEPQCERLSAMRFWALTGAIVVCSFGVALVADDLGDILGIVGASGISVISFVLPGLFYANMEGVRKAEGEWYRCKRNGGLFFAVFGIVLIPFCIVMQFVPVD